MEVLIINDGSKDKTATIANEYVEKYPDTFFIINKENGGWGSTLNSGIRHGTGKYFKQLDGDDYFSSENIDIFIEFLKQADEDMVYSPFVMFTDKNGAILRFVGDYGNTVPIGEKMNMGEIPGFTPAMHTLCIKLDILKKNKLHITENCFYTDVEFVLKCCHLCKNLVFFELPIYYYRLAHSGQSMSIQGVRKHYKDHLKMLYTMLNYEKKYTLGYPIQKIFKRRLLSVCEFQYIFFFALECTKEQKEEIIQYDTILKNNFPIYYKSIGNNAVKMLRKMHFMGYKLIAKIQTKRDKKRKINIFEGC